MIHAAPHSLSRCSARLLAVLGLAASVVVAAGPAWSQAQPAPAQPTPLAPAEPKTTELRKAVQTRQAGAPARQLTPDELQRLREQIREQRVRTRTTTLHGDRP